MKHTFGSLMKVSARLDIIIILKALLCILSSIEACWILRDLICTGKYFTILATLQLLLLRRLIVI